ncbi:hypothetical protein [Micromonospora sp. WMMD710]|uniref:hypothetical protein n=1 Tax=Micromonospora sp. WMMD710 TaxID=3016085 RepID=UPI002417D1AA|nr:hypothetical protein [Micromonospora sp. WMMD710]MDG4757520.1 hypothetical protein [Micromonospora sp. WMMD710]
MLSEAEHREVEKTYKKEEKHLVRAWSLQPPETLKRWKLAAQANRDTRRWSMCHSAVRLQTFLPLKMRIQGLKDQCRDDPSLRPTLQELGIEANQPPVAAPAPQQPPLVAAAPPSAPGHSLPSLSEALGPFARKPHFGLSAEAWAARRQEYGAVPGGMPASHGPGPSGYAAAVPGQYYEAAGLRAVGAHGRGHGSTPNPPAGWHESHFGMSSSTSRGNPGSR